MEQCIYCEKTFKKRGIKIHNNKCKKKIQSTSFISIEEGNCSNLLISAPFGVNDNWCTILQLPNECINIINDYLLYKEKYQTYQNYYRTHLQYALTCKRFYNIFMLDKPRYNTLFEEEETHKKIHRKEAIVQYGVSENELDIIYGNKEHRKVRQYEIIYPLVKIMNYAYKKYGSYNKYIKQKQEEEKRKREEEQRKNEEIRNRREQLHLCTFKTPII